MTNSPLDYENKNEEQKKQSRAGIISSFIFLIEVLFLIPAIFFRESFSGDTRFNGELYIYPLFFGLIAGTIAIFQTKRIKFYRYLGFFGNIGVLLIYIIVIIYGVGHLW